MEIAKGGFKGNKVPDQAADDDYAAPMLVFSRFGKYSY
jgi:hypothetical protein